MRKITGLNCNGIGRIISDPEISEIGSTKTCEFKFVFERQHKNKYGKLKTDTDFISGSLWDSAAEYVYENCPKNTLLWFEGVVQQERWETDNQEERQRHKIKINNFRVIECPDRS